MAFQSKAVTGDTVPLNRSEHGYAAIEGLAGTMVQPYLMRFDTPVSEAQVRAVLRQLVTAYPRLRAALEPGLHRYHLRILPEGPLIDQMFELAFRAHSDVNPDDPAQLQAWHWRALNEVLPLERGLGLRAHFAPHPQRPALIFGVPHLLADGMTMVELVRQILRGLNGLPVEAMPLEAPSMLGSIAPERWWQWPQQVWRSRQHKVAEARRLASVRVQQLPTELGQHYSTTGLRHHTVPTPVADLRRAARQLGVSLNTLLVSAIAQTFLDQAPHDPQAAAVIRISVNLRKYHPAAAGHGPMWGNHVGAFLVIEQDARKPWGQRVTSVDAAIKEGQARYARREMCWTYLLEELMPFLGRTLVGHIGLKLKRAGRFPAISCHATSLGDVGSIHPSELDLVGHPEASRVRVAQLVPLVNSISPLPVLVELDGALSVPMSWQLGETSPKDVAAFHARLDDTLARLVREVLAASGAPKASEGAAAIAAAA